MDAPQLERLDFMSIPTSHNKLFYIVVFVFLLMVLTSLNAKAASLQNMCETQLPRMSVELSIPKLTYEIDKTVSYKNFPDRRNQRSHGLQSIGLTVINYTASYEFEAQKLEDRTNKYECLTAKIKVRLTVPPLKVYVGNEFPEGTCAYKEILAHEMRHVDTYQRHFVFVQTEVNHALNKRFKNQKPQYARIGQSMRLLNHELRYTWMPYINSMVKYGNQYHQIIDTVAETERVSMSCQGEVQRAMRKANSRTM